MAVTRSAMLDGRRAPEPRQFRTERPTHAYLHFDADEHGSGDGAEDLQAVLKQPEFKCAPELEGRLHMKAGYGIFPKHLVVDFS